jgi:hypothetical protein
MAHGQWRGAVNVSLGCLAACALSLVVCAGSAQAAFRCVVHGHSVAGVRTSKLIERGALSGFHVSGSWLIVTRDVGQVEIDECEKYQQADSQDCPGCPRSDGHPCPGEM